MTKPLDYTMARRIFACAAVALLLLCAAPQVLMHGDAAASPAESGSDGPQIPVGKPTKPQTNAQEQKGAQAITRVHVNIVRLYVTVRDKHNAIVTNLNRDDFRVYENGELQKIAIFSKDMTDPLTLAMMIDTSGSQNNLLGAEKETAIRFLHEILRKNDLAAAISFDTDVNLLADFTDDQDVLDKAINSAEINVPVNMGSMPDANVTGTALYDAIYLTCNEQMAGQAGRKALIILTDAEDEGSKHSLDEAITAAQQSNTVVHVLLIADVGGYFMSGMSYNGGFVARKMAEATGGRVIEIRREKDLDKAFDELSQELRSQYIIGYYPSDTKADGTYRTIKVETTTKDLRILTRKGYYAPSGQY